MTDYKSSGSDTSDNDELPELYLGLSPAQEEILLKFRDDYKKAQKGPRQTIRAQAVKELQALSKEEKTTWDEKDTKRVWDWFRHRARKGGKDNLFRFTKAWGYRTIVAEDHKADLENITPGVGAWQRKLTEIIDGLTEEELDAYRVEARNRKTKGAPMELRSRYVLSF
jgi:hypothetical protein